MKNLMISYSKLPESVRNAIQQRYPHGFDHETFEFGHPTREEVYTVFRFTLDSVNYLIKLEKRERTIDRTFDL